ncbi:hypothetical protein R3P38DRAFT_3193716 [Favolaschia claudopus]|uniref:Uncharacterized protein n=1 Tax=Favolaschia claudopus TaxID=2862362 RepID=A0AAW0BFW7_9AGAR
MTRDGRRPTVGDDDELASPRSLIADTHDVLSTSARRRETTTALFPAPSSAAILSTLPSLLPLTTS